MVKQPLAKADISDTWLAFDMLAGMVQQPLPHANTDDMWFAFSMLAGSAKLPYKVPDADPFVWNMLAGSAVHEEPEETDPAWIMLEGMAREPKEWGESWFPWQMLKGMVPRPLTKINPADSALTWSLLAGSGKSKPVQVNHEWRRRLYEAEEQSWFVWNLLAGSVAMGPLAKADPVDTQLAFNLLKGSAKKACTAWYWNEETLVWDMLAESASPPKDTWGESWFAWKMLAGTVQHPLATANPVDTDFAWSMLAGSARPTPKKMMTEHWRRRLHEAEEAAWFVWNLLAGSAPRALPQADPADTWTAFKLLKGSAKKACTAWYWNDETLVLDMLADSARPKADEWGQSWFAWEKLAGMVQHPLAKPCQNDTWLAVKMLERFCAKDKSFLSVPTPTEESFSDDEKEAWFVWEMLAGSCIYPQLPLAKADPNDMWIAFDLLSGMVQQPAATMDPNDMLAWELLAGSAIKLESEAAKAAMAEVDRMQFEHDMVWHMLAGSVVTSPLARADLNEMWFAFEMMAGSAPRPLDEPCKDLKQMWWVWNLLAGSASQTPLLKADDADTWFAFEMLAGSSVQLQSDLARAMAEEVEFEEEFGIAWILLAGMVKQPLAKADPADTQFAFKMLSGMVKHPRAKADTNDMWFAFELLAGSAKETFVYSQSETSLAWELLAGMVQKPLAKADPANMWFAWNMLTGSALPTVVTLKPIRVDWASDALTWDLLAGSAIELESELGRAMAKEVENEELLPEIFVWEMLAGMVKQPLGKADSSEMWFAWSLLADSAKEIDWDSSTLAWDLLTASVPQPAKADTYDMFAWDMLAGMVKQPLAKADITDMWFAWEMLAGSEKQWDWESPMLAWNMLAGSALQALPQMDPDNTFAWDMLAGMVKQPSPKADESAMWFVWDLLAGSAKDIDWESETLIWDLLAGSVPQPGKMDPYDMLAWQMLAGSVKEPLVKADAAVMWFAFDLLAGSAIPAKPVRYDWSSETLAWNLLAGSVPQPARADPYDTLAWDLLCGSVKQPLAQADPVDMQFTWKLLEGMVQQPLSKAGSASSSTKKTLAPSPRNVCDWDLVSGSVKLA
eukprot:gnl/MRDRNA2_/MRDRNA2_25151_c0_seq1.p1 gnl/MRDRNA2_/MRDRNA2_25151_c0~~gnl/MRDRNA2_/MRDRNA2_25151_c0_seq1.p1  ORF type:complete len:1073 (-),score=268.34 gnl/MRDRNA2_/MRDRNA2_25151_c0_seq1:335-3553(-)